MDVLIIGKLDRSGVKLQRRLTSIGHSVTFAATGPDAWRSLQKTGTLKLILVEETLSSRDRNEFFEKLNADERFSEVPVLVASQRTRADASV